MSEVDTIKPLANAKYLGLIVSYISSLTWTFQDVKLIILTMCASFFDTCNRFSKSHKACQAQAERYVRKELGRNLSVKKVAIVTGSNTGLGYTTVEYLLKAQFRVIMACRNETKAIAAIEKLKSNLGQDVEVEFIRLDLTELSSVKSFVKEFSSKGLPLHLLINNAGLMKLCSNEVTKEGLEIHFQSNYLGHYLLTRLLETFLVETPGSRLLFLGSLVHYGANQFSLDNFLPQSSFDASSGYCYSKFAATMLAYHYSRRLEKKGVFVGVADPGTTATELFRTLPLPSWVLPLFIQPPVAGILSTLKLALDDLPNPSTLYCLSETLIPPNPLVLDRAHQETLWKASETFVETILKSQTSDIKSIFK